MRRLTSMHLISLHLHWAYGTACSYMGMLISMGLLHRAIISPDNDSRDKKLSSIYVTKAGRSLGTRLSNSHIPGAS